MAKRYIMTVLAVNRTGILAALANALDELGGNMRDVSQAVIDKYFAVIMAAEFPEDQDQEVIVDHIRAICRPFGAEVTLRDPSGDTGFDGETEQDISGVRVVKPFARRRDCPLPISAEAEEFLGEP